MVSSFISPFSCTVLTQVPSGVALSKYRNKVVLVVNTASECGFTKQYKPLQSLYEDLKSKYPNDFDLLAFPCNQFGGQEPGSDADIQNFCSSRFKTTFQLMPKTDVNGADAEPAWEWMKAEKPGLMGMKRIKWNFEKFLIGADGQVKGRWASTTDPESLKKTIVDEIEKGKKA